MILTCYFCGKDFETNRKNQIEAKKPTCSYDCRTDPDYRAKLIYENNLKKNKKNPLPKAWMNKEKRSKQEIYESANMFWYIKKRKESLQNSNKVKLEVENNGE